MPAALTVSGYGITSGGGDTDGRLRSLPIALADPDECDDDDNAIEICAESPQGSACSGDSGGPVIGPGPVLVGVVSNGPRACPPGGANRYTSLAVPENRAFIAGAADPPRAPRRSAPARIEGIAAQVPRVGQTFTCDGGDFSGEDAQRAEITTDAGLTVLLATGRRASAPITADLVGHRLRCRGYGSSTGGVSLSNRVETELPVAAASSGACGSEPPAQAALKLEAPARARPGQRVAITATATSAAPSARAVLFLVKRAASGAATLRLVRNLPGSGGSLRARLTVRVPRAATVGTHLSYQVVAASFPSRAAANQARGLGGACDAGEGTFGLDIVR